MLTIEAGPYELIRPEVVDATDPDNPVQRFDKVTLCLMSDNSISQRHYNKYGGVTGQKINPATHNLDDAFKALEIITERFKKNNYVESGDAFIPPKPKAVTQL